MPLAYRQRRDVSTNGTVDAKAPRELPLVEVDCPVCGSSERRVIATGSDYEYRTCSNVFTFVCCQQCSTAYLSPRPQLADLGVVYPTTYYSFADDSINKRRNALVQIIWNRIERRRIRLFTDLIGNRRAKVLDLGCGRGRLLQLLRAYGSPQWELFGIEMGAGGGVRIEGIRTYEGIYEQFELPEAPFNLIVAQQVIEHAYSPAKMMAKIHHDLLPGGYAVIDTPNFNGIDRKLFGGGSWGGYHFPRHMTLFTPDTLARLARDSGFDVVSSQKLLSPVFWVLSLHNLLVRLGVPARMAAVVHYQNLPLIALSSIIEMPNVLFGRTSNMRTILRRA
jgi:SAM-dependent methyltransferase